MTSGAPWCLVYLYGRRRQRVSDTGRVRSTASRLRLALLRLLPGGVLKQLGVDLVSRQLDVANHRAADKAVLHRQLKEDTGSGGWLVSWHMRWFG